VVLGRACSTSCGREWVIEFDSWTNIVVSPSPRAPVLPVVSIASRPSPASLNLSHPNPPLSTPRPQPIAPQSTQRDIYYIHRTRFRAAPSEGRVYIYIGINLYTCPCVLNVVVVCVYYSPSSDASASGYLYVFVRNVCQLCILCFLTKRAPTCVFLTPFFVFFFSAASMCLFVVFHIILFRSHASQTRDACIDDIIYTINVRPNPPPTTYAQIPDTHTQHIICF